MSTDSSNVLSGVTVISLALNIPGPLATARLAEMGAAVVKVEPPTGDLLRRAAPTWYDELVVDVDVVTLDLKDSVDRSALERQLAGADVLMTAMRPSALERLSLRASAERHGLVIVEIVGHDGERADEAGHDLTYQAVHGTVLPPALPVVPLVDILGAERAVSAAFVGLRQREAGEPSPHLRVVLDEVARDAAAPVRHVLTGPGAMLGGAAPTYNVYPSADGYVAVAALEPHFAERLATAVGQTSEELTERFATMPSAYWESLGREVDIPIVAVDDLNHSKVRRSSDDPG